MNAPKPLILALAATAACFVIAQTAATAPAPTTSPMPVTDQTRDQATPVNTAPANPPSPSGTGSMGAVGTTSTMPSPATPMMERSNREAPATAAGTSSTRGGTVTPAMTRDAGSAPPADGALAGNPDDAAKRAATARSGPINERAPRADRN